MLRFCREHDLPTPNESDVAANRNAIVRKCARSWRTSLDDIQKLADREIGQAALTASLLSNPASKNNIDRLFREHLWKMIRKDVEVMCRSMTPEDRDDLVQEVAKKIHERIRAGAIRSGGAATLRGYVVTLVRNRAGVLRTKSERYESIDADPGRYQDVSASGPNEPPRLTFRKMIVISYAVPMQPQQRLVWFHARLLEWEAKEITKCYSHRDLEDMHTEFINKYSETSTLPAPEVVQISAPFVRDLERPLRELVDHPQSRRKYQLLLDSRSGGICLGQFAGNDLTDLRENLIPQWTLQANKKIQIAFTDAIRQVRTRGHGHEQRA
jgi:hypothetical protein